MGRNIHIHTPSQKGYMLLHMFLPLLWVVHSVECAVSRLGQIDCATPTVLVLAPLLCCVACICFWFSGQASILSPQRHPAWSLTIISVPRSRWQLATARDCQQVCAHRGHRQGGQRATEAGSPNLLLRAPRPSATVRLL